MESPEVLDVSKENIQPLRQGRNASQLSTALQAQTDATILQNLVKKRQEYELLLRTYDGDDPLSIWFEYVEWVEQSFPKHGKEGNLVTLLQNCLSRFKDSVEYFQDVRLIKLWIKYLEMVENPLEFYNQLLCHGIGSQCAIFYKSWADELYDIGDFKQADKVLLQGITRNAQPIDELTRSHQNFQIAVARRLLDESSAENVAEEERKVGSLLTTFGKKHKVPSVRVGDRVKLGGPGTLHCRENLAPRRNVDPVNVFEAENDPELASSINKMQNVPHLEILKKENTKKPTPWSGVKQKSTNKFHPPKPTFQVLGDENVQSEPLNSVVFLNALKPKKKYDGFHCPVAVFEVPNPNQKPMYPKDQVYAGGTEYSLEELKAVKYMKHKERRNRELLLPDSQDVVQKKVAACTLPHSAELENLNPLTVGVSKNSSVTTFNKKDNNSFGYTENEMLHHEQQLSAFDNNYEKCAQSVISSNVASDSSLEDRKLSEQSSVPTNKYHNCVERPKCTDSAADHLVEINNLCVFGSHSDLTTPIEKYVVGGKCVPENVKLDNILSTPNKEDIPCSANANITLPCNEPSSCRSPLLAENVQQKVNHQGTYPVTGSCSSVFTAADDVGLPETVKAGDFSSSLNKECAENAGIMLSSNISSSYIPVLLVEKDQQKVNNQGAFPVKESCFSVFTADDDTGSPETVKAGDFFSSLNKECAENAGIMVSSNMPSSCSPVLVAEHEQQKLNKQDTFSLKGNCFSIFTTEGGTDTLEENVEVGGIFTSKKEEVVFHSDHANNVLSSNERVCLSSPVLMCGTENVQPAEIQEGKISLKGNRVPEFPIFNDEENCVVEGRLELLPTEQENGFPGVPNSSRNLFSHSVLCGPNKLSDNVRPFSSTTKKNKVVPFQLFIDDSQGPEHTEPCETKRALFKDMAREPSGKLCDADSKENMALLSAFVPSSRPVAVKREMKISDNIVTASMLKLKLKKPAEQLKESAAAECEQVTPATAVPKISEGCVSSSISACSEEVLKVINECWASPPKSAKDAEHEIPSVFHKQPQDIDFEQSRPLTMSIGLTEETRVFPKNKENALPECTEQQGNLVEPATNTSLNDDLLGGQLGESKELDDTCCTLLFSKTLISSTPNRKSSGPLGSDSSDTSHPDIQEFKIPRRCAPIPAERLSIIPRPDVLSVIMESSKENKSQNSTGSSSGGRAIHQTASSLVSPQTENINCTLETQSPSHAYPVTNAISLPSHEGNSSYKVTYP